VEFYSAIRKNKIMLFSGKWMEVEIIMLGEINQYNKERCCIVSHVESGVREGQECKREKARNAEEYEGKREEGEEVNMIKLNYMHVWKCHKEIPC
jgi:hypothetical protein